MNRLTTTRAWRTVRAVHSVRHERRMLRSIRDAQQDGRDVVLVINHFFDNELKILREHEGFANHIVCVSVPPSAFYRNLAYFPPKVWTAHSPYEEHARGKARSRRHAERLWDAILALGPIRAVIAPSDIFYWLRQFILAGQSRDVPTLVFDKEGTISPSKFEEHPGIVAREFPPISDRFYVWSERQRAYWELSGLDPQRIRVLGSLRTDEYVRMPPAQRPSVLWFDYDPGAYLNFIDPADLKAHPPGNWSPIKTACHDALLRVARDFPDVTFTIKTHPQQTDVQAVQSRFADATPNVQVRAGSIGVPALVEAHSLCVGFQTTALVEAALTGRPCIYAGWGTLHEHAKPGLVPLFETGYGLHQVASAEELESRIRQHLHGEPLDVPSMDRMDDFFVNADGHAADRYYEAFVEDTRSRQAWAIASPSASVNPWTP